MNIFLISSLSLVTTDPAAVRWPTSWSIPAEVCVLRHSFVRIKVFIRHQTVSIMTSTYVAIEMACAENTIPATKR